MGEMIEFPSGGDVCPGYRALPASGYGAGVVVIQEWWGLVEHIKDVCDRLAAQGFVALAPDLYHGRRAGEPDEAQKEMMKLDLERVAVDIDSAAAHLAGSAAVEGSALGVVGFCMGGGLALFAASRNPALRACVVYYGVGPAREHIDLSGTRAAVLAHWGERDHSYDHATIEELEKRLQEAGVSVESFWYDADHAFFNDDRPEVYEAAAARLSWDRTVAFLRRHLAP